MKPIKLFALAVIATCALTGIAGAGTAAALTELEEVVWCKERIQQCPANKHFPPGTVVHAQAPDTVFLLGALGEVTCALSEMLLTNSSLLAHGEVTGLEFDACLIGKNSCAVAAENLPYLFSAALSGNHTTYDLLVTEKNPNGAPQIAIECPFFINCTFSANSVLYNATLANITGEKMTVLQEFNRVAGLCPETMTWHANYIAQCLEGGVLKRCWIKMEIPT